MRVFGPNRLLANQFGGHVFVFGGDFLSDFASGFLTGAANLVGGFQDDALHFQLHGREGTPFGAGQGRREARVLDPL